MRSIHPIVLFVLCSSLWLSCSVQAEPLEVNSNYLQSWNNFETKLIREEKSFQISKDLDDVPAPYKRVEYVSDGMTLAAVLLMPDANLKPDSIIRKPAIVYLHGGFALQISELKAAKPFVDAGFVVMAPSWRGENGNPGYFECFMGEVKDAKAAIRWLAKQNYVDPDRIYVFGWSVGGGIALNLALHDDIPIKLSGSSAGIYDLGLIESWATEDDYIKFPYDYKNKEENYFRLPLYNLQHMVRPHYSYIARNDDYDLYRTIYDDLYPQDKTQLRIIEVPGNHVSSVSLAIERFLRIISPQH